MKVADPLHFLLGNWSITRSIHDHRSGGSGMFEGLAVFTETEFDENSGLVTRASYEELGELRFGAHAGEAHRRLEYVRRGSAGIEVFLADGGPFVHLDLSTGTWQATHPCGDDHHEIVFTVASADEIREFWRVRGPETDYEAEAFLKRRT
jgi:hypothetical protein